MNYSLKLKKRRAKFSEIRLLMLCLVLLEIMQQRMDYTWVMPQYTWITDKIALVRK